WILNSAAWHGAHASLPTNRAGAGCWRRHPETTAAAAVRERRAARIHPTRRVPEAGCSEEERFAFGCVEGTAVGRGGIAERRAEAALYRQAGSAYLHRRSLSHGGPAARL